LACFGAIVAEKAAARGEASREKQTNTPILLKYYKRLKIKT